MIRVHQRPRQTDRQTDRWTDRWTNDHSLLSQASCSKNTHTQWKWRLRSPSLSCSQHASVLQRG